MLDIQITDSIKIISDDKNYILQKRNKITNNNFGKKKIGDWSEWKDDGYYQDWDHLTEEVLHLKIRQSTGKTLREVCSIIKAFKMPKSS